MLWHTGTLGELRDCVAAMIEAVGDDSEPRLNPETEANAIVLY